MTKGNIGYKLAETIDEFAGLPDLIEALECWVDDAQYDPACAELLAESDAALAKAKGES